MSSTEAVITMITDKRKEKEQAKLQTKNAVVRFKRKDHNKVKRTYVALFIGGRWWTTSTITGLKIMSNNSFLELMASPDVSKIEVATGWAPVE